MSKISNLTSIILPKEIKNKLDKVKIHRREPYYDVIDRLVEKEIERLKAANKATKPEEIIKEVL